MAVLYFKEDTTAALETELGSTAVVWDQNGEAGEDSCQGWFLAELTQLEGRLEGGKANKKSRVPTTLPAERLCQSSDTSALWGMEEEKVWEQDTRRALFLETFDFMFMGNPLGR